MKNKQYLNFKRFKKNVQGITLIALVVTVIVLLILTGVAINLTVGDNGLFRRAQNAVDTWQMAEQNEQIEMDKASNFIEDYMNGGSGTVGDLKPSEGEEVTILDKTTEVEDGLENKVVIPGGFGIAADSGTNVEDGIVIEDLDENQFVWIPVSVLDEETGEKTPIHTSEGDIIIDYTRTAYSTNVATGETDDGTNSERINYSSSNSNYFTEAMPSDELQSVTDNGGYYIGRFEAGDKESTEEQTMREDGASQTNTVTIKSGQAPYNRITQVNAKTLAEEMDTVQGYSTATTKLVSSYAWDTAIDFIQKAKSAQSTYGNSSLEGNYLNRGFDYANLGETEKNNHKNENTETLVPTGQTTPVINIYDMGGNLWEWTTESSSYGSNPYVYRGGDYGDGYGNYPAGHRLYCDNSTRSGSGFRVTLYVK